MELPQPLLILLLFYVNVVYSCPNDCHGNGLCNSGHCTCYAGYFKNDCSQNVKDTNPTTLMVLQAVLGFLFLFNSVLCFIALYSVLAKRNMTVPIIQNIRAIVFASSLAISVTQLVFLVDPLETWGILNTLARFLLNAAVYPCTIIAFVSILFHWVDLINISLATLRREMMLQKISVREYKPKDITVEDMVDRLKFLGTLKPHFVVIVTFFFLFTFGTETVAALIPSRRRLMRLCWFSVDAMGFIVLAAGFLYYRRKMIKIMPPEITNKVKKLTTRLTLLTIFLFGALVTLFLASILVARDSAAQYLGMWVLIELCVATLCFGLPAVFFQWQSRFPFISFSSTNTRDTERSSPSLQTDSSSDTAMVKSASDNVELGQLQPAETITTSVQIMEE